MESNTLFCEKDEFDLTNFLIDLVWPWYLFINTDSSLEPRANFSIFIILNLNVF